MQSIRIVMLYVKNVHNPEPVSCASSEMQLNQARRLNFYHGSLCSFSSYHMD
jgi:hypothetical protein